MKFKWHGTRTKVNAQRKPTAHEPSMGLAARRRAMKPLPPIEFTQVQSDAAELQGAAHAAGARGLPSRALTGR